MTNPNKIDAEYVTFLKQFKDGWPTNLEFFKAARTWEKEKRDSQILWHLNDGDDGDYFFTKESFNKLFGKEET